MWQDVRCARPEVTAAQGFPGPTPTPGPRGCRSHAQPSLPSARSARAPGSGAGPLASRPRTGRAPEAVPGLQIWGRRPFPTSRGSPRGPGSTWTTPERPSPASAPSSLRPEPLPLRSRPSQAGAPSAGLRGEITAGTHVDPEPQTALTHTHTNDGPTSHAQPHGHSSGYTHLPIQQIFIEYLIKILSLQPFIPLDSPTPAPWPWLTSQAQRLPSLAKGLKCLPSRISWGMEPVRPESKKTERAPGKSMVPGWAELP